MTLRFRLSILLSLTLADLCWGTAATGPALIVNDGTAGIEVDLTNNLSGKLTAAGYMVTTNTGVPGGSLASYKQIWDLRYNNTTPLTPSDITAYIGYLAGGGSLFVMGENIGFLTRDNSIKSLIQAAGGGTINVVSASNAETVQAPFTGPNAVSSIVFLAAAGTMAAGSLSFIAKGSNGIGAGILYGPGALSNAPNGSLLVVFDVNFLLGSADAASQALSNNMVAYLASPVPVPPVISPPAVVGTPTLSGWAMILLGCGLTMVACRRLLSREHG